MSKIIQISAYANGELHEGTNRGYTGFYALTDDGRVMCFNFDPVELTWEYGVIRGRGRILGEPCAQGCQYESVEIDWDNVGDRSSDD